MAQEWHYEINGERQGPVTPRQLKQLAISGELRPSDLIWKEGMAGWKPAKSIKGLFLAASQSAGIEPPPIPEHSTPTAPSQSESTFSPTEQLGLLKKMMTKFAGLTTPQKFLVSGVGGMGVIFFLCMGTCGLFGFLGDSENLSVETEVIEVEKPPAGQPAQKQPVPSDARPLKVRIGTVTDKSGWMPKFNSSLENVKCHATSDQVIIDFDVDKSKWIFQYRLQLLVRLFDRNGNHLTNFTTEEKFTMFPEVFKVYSSPTKTLKAKGNRLIYNVNIRDLRDAAMIEIGFSHDSP